MKLKQTLITAVFTLLLGAFLVSPIASAAAGDPCGTGTLEEGESCCGGVATSVIACDDSGQGGIFDLLFWAINILTAGVGVLAVGGIVYASVKYASSGGDTEKTKKAKAMIRDIVMGLIAYALMYTFINFLIPGGLFKP